MYFELRVVRACVDLSTQADRRGSRIDWKGANYIIGEWRGDNMMGRWLPLYYPEAEEAYREAKDLGEFDQRFEKFDLPAETKCRLRATRFRNADPAKGILDLLSVPQDVKAIAWDAYYRAKDTADFDRRFENQNLPDDIKARLRGKRFPN